MKTTRWQNMVNCAARRIARRRGWDKNREIEDQIASEIIAAGEGRMFLSAAKRGRPSRRTHKAQFVAAVERLAP